MIIGDRLYAVREERITVEGNPVYLYLPEKSEKNAGIIFYHGWSSSAALNRFRAQIFASHGYTVFLPDALYHGERGNLDYQDRKEVARHFFEVIEKSGEEFAGLEQVFLRMGISDIMVAGHSMGGYTAALVISGYQNLRSAAVFNGSFQFAPIVEKIFEESAGKEREELLAVHRNFTIDPLERIDDLVDRPILMMNGAEDAVVLPKWQREFYEKIKPMYAHPSRLRYVEYPNLGHFVTTNMMEEAVCWADRYLGGNA